MLEHGDAQLIGHNLDDYIEVPGLIVVNKRDIAKESISWAELYRPPLMPRNMKRALPRTRWVSKYGSVTYNTGGKEFIDGGMNEAGLYVGEMNLLGTRYPRRDDLPKLYHHQWLQYLLDNYERVDQVIDSLSRVIVDGHCLWHFLIADKGGQVAVIEFLEGEPVVYAGRDLPIPVLCNAAYASELEKLSRYEGFGGTQRVDYADTGGDHRFAQAATMLQQYEHNPVEPALDYAFKILHQIKGESNRWGLLYDVRKRRLYFYTYKAGDTRYIDFDAFDMAGNTPAMVLDIHRDLAGDVSRFFMPFDPKTNREHIFWTAIKSPGVLGLLNMRIVFPIIMRRMTDSARRARYSPSV